MCSVCGAYRMREGGSCNLTTAVSDMNRALFHRGPDDSGVFSFGRGALGHNRLSVIDPTDNSQPMTVTYGNHRYTIVYNGEIYNTDELRRELAALGISFHTYSDTEVVLHAYAVYGRECPKKLNGIFAFCVYDEAKDCLFLARDRFGIKPLFYTECDGDFLFASEVKALLQRKKPRLGREGLWQLFYLSPARINGSGVLKDIYELKPAECGYLTEKGLQTWRYWHLTAAPCNLSREEIIAHTRELVTDAIERQLVSDRPLATLLSGGLDSSVITAVSANAYRRMGRTLATYSFTYEDMDSFHATLFQPNSDDAYALWLAERLGTAHTVLTAKTETVSHLLPDAALARDMPGQADIDSSLYYYCGEIKKRHTVVLSGECADEIFGGYPWFYREEMFTRDFFPWIHEPRARISLLRPELARADEGYAYIRQFYRETLNDTDCLPEDDLAMRQSRRATRLSVDYFMTNLLERKDRMSMAHALEVRVPFADHRILEWVYNVPWQYKFEGGVEKSLLRHAMADLLPERILWRKKSPYPKTHSAQYDRLVRARLAERMESPHSILHRILNRAALTALCEGESVTWYGQLMSTPQLLAWLIQLDAWVTANDIVLEDE